MITDHVSGKGPYGYKRTGENGSTWTTWYEDEKERDRAYSEEQKRMNHPRNKTVKVDKLKR